MPCRAYQPPRVPHWLHSFRLLIAGRVNRLANNLNGASESLGDWSLHGPNSPTPRPVERGVVTIETLHHGSRGVSLVAVSPLVPNDQWLDNNPCTETSVS